MSAHVKARYGRMTSGRERRTLLRMLALTVVVAMACLAGPLLMATPAHSQTECGTAFGDGTAGITAQTSGNVVTCAYTITGGSGGEFVFTPPAGVTQRTGITVVGGSGTNGSGSPGGAAAGGGGAGSSYASLTRAGGATAGKHHSRSADSGLLPHERASHLRQRDTHHRGDQPRQPADRHPW
ncbi:hypothetical protein [Streptomyces sp. NPDC055134]